jgi:hypothetical protein
MPQYTGSAFVVFSDLGSVCRRGDTSVRKWTTYFPGKRAREKT